MKRIILEMGVGTDLEGTDYTKAACRAVEDALRHVYMPLFRARGLDTAVMEVAVTIAAQRPEAVDRDAVAAVLPYGRISVDCVHGGLDVAHEGVGETSVIVNAALDVRHPMA